MQQYEMTTDKTARKVTAASWAASAATVVIFFLKVYVIKDTQLPDFVENALGLVLAGVISWAASWIAGRTTRPASTDTIQPSTPILPDVAKPIAGIPDGTNDKTP